MHLVTRTTALLLALSLTTPSLADTVRCESSNGRENFCPANTYGGVTLSTQLSSSGCYQGENWGYDNRGIWVSGGCRADFYTGGYAGNNYHQNNGYYGTPERRSNNDGAKVAIALGAILGAAVIASAASKNKGNGGSYQNSFDRGCDAARSDRNGNRGRDYDRHGSSYDGSNEQAFSSGYNQCWNR